MTFLPSTARPAEGFYFSRVRTWRDWPLRTFLPTGYEPRYPYPLLVFFHGHGSNEQQVLQLAPLLSRRNFICIGLRGLHPVTPRADGRPAFTWGQNGEDETALEDYVLHAIAQTRRYYHVHSERIYLAGFCEGATLAYRLALSQPEKFAGLISLNGCLPRTGRPLLRLPEARRLRVLIGHGYANAVFPLAYAREDYRLFYSAGLDVQLRTYPSTHRIHPAMLRDINSWIIRHINLENDLASPR